MNFKLSILNIFYFGILSYYTTFQFPIGDENAKQFDLDDLNHIDGLPIEIDGMINRDVHKEIFLGDHEDFDNMNEETAVKRLNSIFISADKDMDTSLSKVEIEVWITQQINSHLESAREKNKKLFAYLDSDKNNLIYWEEFLATFKHLHRNDDKDNDLLMKKELRSIRERWSNTDTNGDNGLNLDEFLIFRHPETNNATLTRMADTLMGYMDQDHDNRLGFEEFFMGQVNLDPNDRNKHSVYSEERRREFGDADVNGNGVIEFSELIEFVNPHNPRQVKNHVEQIFNIVDTNKDNLISLNEMLNNIPYFINSNFLKSGFIVHEDL